MPGERTLRSEVRASGERESEDPDRRLGMQTHLPAWGASFGVLRSAWSMRALAACLLPLSVRAVDVPVSWSFTPDAGGVTTVSLKQLPQPPFRLPLFAERPAVCRGLSASGGADSLWLGVRLNRWTRATR